jgi:hypothetical protein
MRNDQPAARALFGCESGLSAPEIGLSMTNGKICTVLVRTVLVCKNNCKLL